MMIYKTLLKHYQGEAKRSDDEGLSEDVATAIIDDLNKAVEHAFEDYSLMLLKFDTYMDE